MQPTDLNGLNTLSANYFITQESDYQLESVEPLLTDLPKHIQPINWINPTYFQSRSDEDQQTSKEKEMLYPHLKAGNLDFKGKDKDEMDMGVPLTAEPEHLNSYP